MVEILVVLATIGILAAILFPVFSSARSTARATACASNLKQIGLAMLLYAQDNTGKLPRGSGSRPRCGWPDRFIRYTRNAEVFQCPDDEEEHPYDPACTTTADAPTKDSAGSYNSVALEDYLTRHEPSKTVLVINGLGNTNTPRPSTRGKRVVLPEDIDKNFGPPRHMDAYNMVFGDGHVKRLAPDKMLDPVLWGDRR